MDYGQFTVSLSLALAHNHLIHPFVLVKHISVFYMSNLCIFRIILLCLRIKNIQNSLEQSVWKDVKVRED